MRAFFVVGCPHLQNHLPTTSRKSSRRATLVLESSVSGTTDFDTHNWPRMAGSPSQNPSRKTIPRRVHREIGFWDWSTAPHHWGERTRTFRLIHNCDPHPRRQWRAGGGDGRALTTLRLIFLALTGVLKKARSRRGTILGLGRCAGISVWR